MTVVCHTLDTHERVKVRRITCVLACRVCARVCWVCLGCVRKITCVLACLLACVRLMRARSLSAALDHNCTAFISSGFTTQFTCFTSTKVQILTLTRGADGPQKEGRHFLNRLVLALDT